MRKVVTTVVSALLIIVLFLSVQCGIEHWPEKKTRQQLRVEKSCDFPVEKDVKLTRGEKCALVLLKERCGNLDRCYVDCITSGRGVNVAGGCTHICNYSLKIDWTAPQGVEQCLEKDPDHLAWKKLHEAYDACALKYSNEFDIDGSLITKHCDKLKPSEEELQSFIEEFVDAT